MMPSIKNVAIIPARKGSKRIPGKNIRLFRGKPLIAWSIAKALESKLFSKVIVSTDDPETAQIAQQYCAEVPFLRSPQLADDFTPLAAVLAETLERLESLGQNYKYASCILATAPLLPLGALLEGHKLLHREGNKLVVSVARFNAPVQRAMTIAADGTLQMLYPEHEFTRSNDLPAAYHDAGQFYCFEVAHFRQTLRLLSPEAHAIVLPSECVQDIDTEEDWRRAELLFDLVRTAED